MRTPSITVLILSLFAAGQGLFAQNLLTNGGLERPEATDFFYDEYAPGSTAIPDWIVGPDGGVDGIRRYWAASEGQDCVDLHHSSLGPGSIYQDVRLTKGQLYRLSFDMTYNPDIGLPVAMGVSIGTVSKVFVRAVGTAHPFWQRQSMTFTATNTGVVRLTFQENGLAPTGSPESAVDNIRLEAVTPQLTIRVSQVELCWGTETNVQYQVQGHSGPATNAWFAVGVPVQGTGVTNCLTDTVSAGEPRRLYRAIVLP